MSLCTPTVCCVDTDCPPNVEPILTGFAIAPTLIVDNEGTLEYNFLDNLNLGLSTVYNVHPCNRAIVLTFVDYNAIATGVEDGANSGKCLILTQILGLYIMFVNKACNDKTKLQALAFLFGALYIPVLNTKTDGISSIISALSTAAALTGNPPGAIDTLIDLGIYNSCNNF